VNNAGVTRDNLVLRLTEDDWDTVIDTDLKGVFNCIRAVARTMVSARSGRIINISSVVGIMGNAGQANYSAAKAGVIGMTKTVARELASRHITVNAIAPGFVETAMTDVLPEEIKQKLKAQIPMRRIASPEEIASAVLFLASDGASYITGQCLAVDGGLAM
jgi:3-oxoacyl-[acyl-carrier protein] reductase